MKKRFTQQHSTNANVFTLALLVFALALFPFAGVDLADNVVHLYWVVMGPR